MSCDSQGQVIFCDSHLSHRWGLSVTHHRSERAGNYWISGNYSVGVLGEVRANNGIKSSDVSESFSCHECDDSLRTHGGSVSPVCVCVR